MKIFGTYYWGYAKVHTGTGHADLGLVTFTSRKTCNRLLSEVRESGGVMIVYVTRKAPLAPEELKGKIAGYMVIPPHARMVGSANLLAPEIARQHVPGENKTVAEHWPYGVEISEVAVLVDPIDPKLVPGFRHRQAMRRS